MVEDAPSSVLAVFAHPDDPDVSCGGSLAHWARKGSEVHVVVCAQGEKGTTDAEADTARVGAVRLAELAAAGNVIGVAAQHLLGYPDGELPAGNVLESEIVALVRRVRPEVVVCHDPEAVMFGQDYFNHRDHRMVGWSTLDAVAPAAALPHYFPSLGPAHQVRTVYLSGTLAPDVWVDIGESIEAKVEAVNCHASQFGGERQGDGGQRRGSGVASGDTWVASAVRRRAQEAGATAGVALAEGFRRLRLAG